MIVLMQKKHFIECKNHFQGSFRPEVLNQALNGFFMSDTGLLWSYMGPLRPSKGPRRAYGPIGLGMPPSLVGLIWSPSRPS